MSETQIQEVIVPVDVALERINSLPFPAVSVGDIAWCDGHRFIYQESGWVNQPQE